MHRHARGHEADAIMGSSVFKYIYPDPLKLPESDVFKCIRVQILEF